MLLKLLKVSPVSFQSQVLWGLVFISTGPQCHGAWWGVSFSGLVVFPPFMVSPTEGLVLNHVSAEFPSTVNYGRFFLAVCRSFSELDA